MPFSHHSHSGQFCGHATNTLEEVVETAIAKRFHTFALTEHIPRPREDFYPEEEADHTEASLKKLFDDYMYETLRIKAKYPLSETKILVGFESEWIRPSTLDIIEGLLTQWKPFLDFFVGSVHHVHTFPIDFDDVTYKQARHKAGGNDIGLFLDYFDAQLDMLQALKPPVVGHFDLIRLKSDDPNTQFTSLGPVWHKIKRNLEFICSYGGCVELNSAALRKGLAEPYPCTSICQLFMSMGGRFTMSDDSHGVAQVGTNYGRLLDFIRTTGIKEIWYAQRGAQPRDERFLAGFVSMSLDELERLPHWKAAS